MPRRTPQMIVSLVKAHIVKLMSDPRAKAVLASQGFEAHIST